VGRTVDVYVPLGTEPLVRGDESTLDRRSTWWLAIFARLQPDQTLEEASAQLVAVQPRIRDETLPQNFRPQDLENYLSEPLRLDAAASGTSFLRNRYQRPLFALGAVVAFTLLIACGNIANLMLARTAARRHEFAVRVALGAPRWRLARQLFGENLLISAIGAVLGVLFALWGSRVILAQIATSTNRVFLDLGLDWRVLGFTGLIAVATTLLFGVAPTLLASRVPPMDALREQGRGSVTGRQARVAGSLVLAQVSLSLLLLVGAGLFVRTFMSLADVDLGFVPDRVLVANVGAQRTGVEPGDRMPLYERMLESALAVPGVTHAALSVITPVSNSQWNGFLEFPSLPDMPERERVVNFNFTSPGWFEMMRTPMISGRDFDSRDRVGGVRAAIVNQRFAEKYFAGKDPVGEMIRAPEGFGGEAAPVEIVGLVADAVYTDLRDPLSPTLYWAMAQSETPPSSVVLTMRTAVPDPRALTAAISAAINRAHADLTVSFRPLDEYISAALSQERLIALLSGFFGLLALLLASLGLYGVTAYSVVRRRTELGIRMALGASPGAVVRLVLSRTGALVLGGILVGGGVSWWASRYVSSLLFGLAPTDPATIAGAMLLLAAVGAVAGWLPARRAAGIDPAEVLREG
jgi:predicted permease